MSPPAICAKPRPRHRTGERGAIQAATPDSPHPAGIPATRQATSDRERLAVALSAPRPLDPFREPPACPPFDPWQHPAPLPPAWMDRRKEHDAARVLAILDNLNS